MMIDVCELRVPIGGWCLEEDSAMGGSGTTDIFLSISGLLRLALEDFGIHFNRVRCARGDGGGWLSQ